MFGKITMRTKVMIGLAVGCAIWIAMLPEASQTIEPARGSAGAAPRARGVQTAPSHRKSPVMNASIGMAERIVKDTTAASLFSPHSWYVAPPPPPGPAVVLTRAVPTAPPLPFAYMGSYRTEGAGQTYFLTAGDRVYDVKIGDTLNNTYSVDGVKSGQLLLTYMPLKIQQSLAVGDD